MARKLKGKINAKGLKGALLRQQAQEQLKKNSQKKLQNKLNQQNNKLSSKINKNKQNQSVQLEQKKFIPFNIDETLLLVGEGDFSFAKSIIEENYIKPENLIVTSFDNSINELKLKYPNSFEENYKFLVDENVKIFFRIDATNLIKSFKISKKNPWIKVLGPMWKFKTLQNIMFNFPHSGKGIKDQDRNIQDHQKLMMEYFKNCKELFHLINSPIIESKLNHSQGYTTDVISNDTLSKEGYGKIIISLFVGEPYDSWQIKHLAKANELQSDISNKFQWNNFSSYHHRRTNSEQDTTKPSQEREARIYVFKKKSS
ncbi:hypothetical protein TBLA_0B06920 [Henningerozyma blattae CBS 6284]|uniref:25S rRNA (uridine-N(3))-methyltransferase BMT5-like domain-containing protein n=1 Tax=Henningerozyma blattae (strain ATCC 34711 / CBS 6284 / DSM 70876 / NBRC 10599 / NRRL Y-10934 / UCD 77-7) TaxID=1071380 RepID=I2GZG1_HENB6|nr:hypothetical protein TBLA_0B06920 [Tetrapisispora blattae CBS 6284]CCH59513.1 hypothetical protein TBLA_0B06920 [Tetrapisispora blattae CBS 6284]